MHSGAQQPAGAGVGEEPLWTSEELAEFLGVSAVTPSIWRARRVGPPALRISNRCVRYSPAQVRAWLAAQVDRPNLVTA